MIKHCKCGETKATPTKRGRKPTNKEADGEATPSKRGRKAKAKPAATAKEEDGGETSAKEDSQIAGLKQEVGNDAGDEAGVEVEEKDVEKAGNEAGDEADEEADEEA